MRGVVHGPGTRTAGRGAALLVFALALLPYLLGGGLSSDFVAFDDDEYVTNNPGVLGGLSLAGLRWALTSLHADNWHPLTWISHMADVTLYGLAPRGHHLTSLLLHAAAAVLLFIALERLTGFRWRSCLVAILFAVHPLHVESVAWVAERKDVLAAVFFGLVLLAYERFARIGGGRRLLALTVVFTLGLAAKPTLVTVPFLLLLLDFWPLGRTRTSAAGAATPWARLFWEKTPLFVVTAGSAALTLFAQRPRAIVPLEALGPGMRLSNALASSLSYLRDALWPASLAVFYPYLGPPDTLVVAGAALLTVGITAAAIALLRRRPVFAVGWLWYLGLLAPVIGLVQVGFQARADRYTYLPLTGVFIVAVWGLAALPEPFRRRALPCLAALAVTAFSLRTAVQVGVWHTSETLFTHAIAATEDNWLAHANLGSVLAAQGHREEAMAHLRRAIDIWPGAAKARYNLAGLLAEQGRNADAAQEYREALRAAPESFQAWNNLGVSLQALGDDRGAEEAFREAVRLRPCDSAALGNLGDLLARSSRPREATASYETALRCNPRDTEALNGLGNLFATQGDLAEAERQYRAALQLRPDFASARINLGQVLLARGQADEAASEFRAALRARPGDATAEKALAAALATAAPPSEAGGQ